MARSEGRQQAAEPQTTDRGHGGGRLSPASHPRWPAAAELSPRRPAVTADMLNSDCMYVSGLRTDRSTPCGVLFFRAAYFYCRPKTAFAHRSNFSSSNGRSWYVLTESAKSPTQLLSNSKLLENNCEKCKSHTSKTISQKHQSKAAKCYEC